MIEGRKRNGGKERARWVDGVKEMTQLRLPEVREALLDRAEWEKEDRIVI